jgi:hypothetical protein
MEELKTLIKENNDLLKETLKNRLFLKEVINDRVEELKNELRHEYLSIDENIISLKEDIRMIEKRTYEMETTIKQSLDALTKAIFSKGENK